ncbi:YbaK/EbsC family protein [Photorhabdus heterorhabditis]|uniref:YbaK/EbsC family protein n=1 Tax=Photorhabdus heterorhabditis TaxID=880156 RepID=UPI0020B83120|nr:YbaK/EbsC family protein [Photorhabdus heterorhabditis]
MSHHDELLSGFLRKRHSVSKLIVHLIFTTKYRRKLLDGRMIEQLREAFLSAAGKRDSIGRGFTAFFAKLTQCVFGAIPPFSFHPDLKLAADPLLFERFDELAFNAGSLECSVILNTKDYRRIAQPELVNFRRVE